MLIVSSRRSTNAQMEETTAPAEPTAAALASARLEIILGASASIAVALILCARAICTICAKRSRRLRLPFLSVYCATPPESPREAVADQPAAGTSAV